MTKSKKIGPETRWWLLFLGKGIRIFIFSHTFHLRHPIPRLVLIPVGYASLTPMGTSEFQCRAYSLENSSTETSGIPYNYTATWFFNLGGDVGPALQAPECGLTLVGNTTERGQKCFSPATPLHFTALWIPAAFCKNNWMYLVINKK